jgi:hypothetical protein
MMNLNKYPEIIMGSNKQWELIDMANGEDSDCLRTAVRLSGV